MCVSKRRNVNHVPSDSPVDVSALSAGVLWRTGDAMVRARRSHLSVLRAFNHLDEFCQGLPPLVCRIRLPLPVQLRRGGITPKNREPDFPQPGWLLNPSGRGSPTESS